MVRRILMSLLCFGFFLFFFVPVLHQTMGYPLWFIFYNQEIGTRLPKKSRIRRISQTSESICTSFWENFVVIEDGNFFGVLDFVWQEENL